MTQHPIALITGASTGIGATYADRLARRGYDLILVARNRERLDAVARRLREETSRYVDVLPADLTVCEQLAEVEKRLREDDRITLLVNNAGAVQHGNFTTGEVDEIEWLITLNVTAPSRLSRAAVPRFLAKSGTAIINVGSVVALTPAVPFGAYGATKAYVLALSQSLQAELGPKGIYVQAVLPGATRTEIWERSGRDVDALKAAMDVNDLVDAALTGFDRREAVTIPSLVNDTAWIAYEQAQVALASGLMQAEPAQRYRVNP